MLKREVAAALKHALNMGFQVHPGALRVLEDLSPSELQTVIKYVIKKKIRQQVRVIDRDDIESLFGTSSTEEVHADLRVLFDPTSKVTSAEGVRGYISLFSSRFAKLRRIVGSRPEAKELRTIDSAKMAVVRGELHVCGLIMHKSVGTNVVRLLLEDPSGSLEILVFEVSLREIAERLLLDQFVMAIITRDKMGRFVARSLILPDVPSHVFNRSSTEVFAVFLSDLHIGSRFFMEGAFRRFLFWLSSSDPIARRVGFVIIGGDLIDGVGIYPNQNKELELQTVEEQLQLAESLLSKVPSHIKVVIAPGNHDPGRRALPQPAIPKKYNTRLWDRENFYMLGNPCVVSLNGVRILVFHGQSIDDVVKITPGLNYGAPTDVMRYLLRLRHLVPIYGSLTPVAPEEEDLLVIDEIPDIFHAGHVHVVSLANYRDVLLLNSGTFQSQTPFQSSVGIEPTPALVVAVNLKTWKVKSVDFGVSN